MVTRVARRVGPRVAWIAALIFGAVRDAGAHPLHTSLTAVRYDPASRALLLSVRVFADDFLAAARAPTPDAPATRAYLVSTLVLTGADGRPLSYMPCGSRRVGELLWICLRAPVPDGLDVTALRVRARLLCERFADQINLVQTEYAGRRRSLLFTRGDAAKPLID